MFKMNEVIAHSSKFQFCLTNYYFSLLSMCDELSKAVFDLGSVFMSLEEKWIYLLKYNWQSICVRRRKYFVSVTSLLHTW